MHKLNQSLAVVFRATALAGLLVLIGGAWTVGQKPTNVPSAPPSGVPVQVEDKTLFVIKEGYFSFTPEDRARAISARIERLSKESKDSIQRVRTYDEEATTAIVAGDVVIMTVTSQDAKAEGKPRQVLAQEYVSSLSGRTAGNHRAGARYSELLTDLPRASKGRQGFLFGGLGLIYRGTIYLGNRPGFAIVRASAWLKNPSVERFSSLAGS